MPPLDIGHAKSSRNSNLISLRLLPCLSLWKKQWWLFIISGNADVEILLSGSIHCIPSFLRLSPWYPWAWQWGPTASGSAKVWLISGQAWEVRDGTWGWQWVCSHIQRSQTIIPTPLDREREAEEIQHLPSCPQGPFLIERILIERNSHRTKSSASPKIGFLQVDDTTSHRLRPGPLLD